METWLERYCAGEHAAVWAEMAAVGSAILTEPLRAEALLVAHETMRRARYNITQLHKHLIEVGYQFTYPEQVHIPPDPQVKGQIAELEQHVGPLPLAVRAWYEIVGSVNLMGEHPSWAATAFTDPLVVDPLELALEHYREWREDVREYGQEEAGPYQLPIAPDSYHKALQAQEIPRTVQVYQIVLPSASADALIGEEPHHTTFVDYLRTCFRWGGLPGLERITARPTELAYLTRDLLPL